MSPPQPGSALRQADIIEASGRIAGLVHRTPVATSATLDQRAGCSLFFKLENLQRGGAFKARGATNAVESLTDDQVGGGVATHSSGNHAQAVAIAALRRGIPAHIVMPEGSSVAKRAAVEGYGASVTSCANTFVAREEALAEVVSQTGAYVVHPYDDDAVIAGQGTAAWELFQDVSDLDMLVVPVGGGGLAAGSLLAAQDGAGVEVVGAEPLLADDAFRSLREGRLLPPSDPITVADGLRTGLGQRNFAILAAAGLSIITVTEEQILAAMRIMWERMKTVVEPSGAVPLAAVLADRDRVADRRVGVMVSGGNVDLCRNDLCNFWN